eukprot:jgi/Mesvir1/8381/Mv12627-RA.1
MVFDVNARDRGLLGRTLRVPTSYWGAGYVAKAQKKYKTDKMTGVVKKLLADPPKQGARTRTWCKECDLAMCSPDCFNDFHNPLIKLPYIDTAPVAKKLLVGVVLTSTRTGGRKEYKKKAQS